MEGWHALIVERHFTTHQHVKNDTKAPYVYLGPRVSSSLKKLRRRKVETTAESLQMATGSKQITETEIDNLDVAIFADKDVLNLEIAVDDAIPVAVVERTGDLAGEFACLLLLEFAVGDDIIKHLASIHKFEEHVPVVIGPDNIS